MTAPTIADSREALRICVRLVLAFALQPLAIIWFAFVLWKLWGWFAPVVGLPVVGYGTVGVAAVLWHAFTLRISSKRHNLKERHDPLTMLALFAFVRGAALLCGWAFHVWGTP